VAVEDPVLLNRVVRTVFNQRRKQLANSLRALASNPVAALQAADIDPTRRPETLSLAEFAALSDVLSGTDNRLIDHRQQTLADKGS
jgi:16S rRNA (adenine1518-N6/adenine1519-N6)-dimethyltransferase